MRIHIKTTPNKELVTYNYQPKLVGALHKWLGENELHGRMALYSFSWLMNAKTDKEGLYFPEGSTFFISFHDDNYLKKVLKSITEQPSLCFGMEVKDVIIEENPDLSDRTHFSYGSPIFIRRLENGDDIHYTFNDKNAGDLLKETLLHKMDIAGLQVDESLSIRFDASGGKAKTKIIDYRGIKNRVNQCPVIIEGHPETKLFAWNVGLGNSTGIGFGSIY